MLYRSITFTNGVISLDQDQITCAPKLIIWPPSICYLVSRPKKVNERMLTMIDWVLLHEASGQGQHCPLYVPYMYLFGRDEYNLSIVVDKVGHTPYP